ncbi:hypothetical protein BJY04DRAFT_219112 [Aspergillus karnatakaensis]|uniref:uncharacterized protein n=1 Tax=Aspergillus karnatakaensis TaxID=1810916 RepID=UPI003CCD87E7
MKSSIAIFTLTLSLLGLVASAPIEERGTNVDAAFSYNACQGWTGSPKCPKEIPEEETEPEVEVEVEVDEVKRDANVDAADGYLVE